MALPPNEDRARKICHALRQLSDGRDENGIPVALLQAVYFLTD